MTSRSLESSFDLNDKLSTSLTSFDDYYPPSSEDYCTKAVQLYKAREYRIIEVRILRYIQFCMVGGKSKGYTRSLMAGKI